MQAAVDGREVDEVLGTHVGVWGVRGIQELLYVLGQLKVAMALGLEWAGEGREVVRRWVRVTGQPLVVEVAHYIDKFSLAEDLFYNETANHYGGWLP